MKLNEWVKYRDLLTKLSTQASDEFRDAVFGADGMFGGVGLENIPRNQIIDLAYALVTKYGEASATLSAQMYDEIAELAKANVPPAVPAETASIDEVGKTVNGILKDTQNEDVLSNSIGRMVKQAAADTTLKNALRDGAQVAWIPHGDTCAFCITLASRGWENVSRKTLKNGHAEHIHSNCDCEYGVRFNSDTKYEGYDPEFYKDMYYSQEGKNSKERINSMRRMLYAKNKGIVGANSDKAEELLAHTFISSNKAITDFEKKTLNAKREQAIITTPEGEVFAKSQGGKRRVVIDEPKQAGFIFSHNHPEPVGFSVADVDGFERAGYKQLRAAAPDKIHILEAVNPIQKKPEERKLANAMRLEWERLDELSAEKRKAFNQKAMAISDSVERRKFVEANNIFEWREKAEEDWLKENAPKYGYYYKTEKR